MAFDGSEKIGVLIVDDQELIRSGFRSILRTYPEIEVLGIAKDGDEAVVLANELKPNVVLMDIRMPGMDGIEATRAIASNPKLKDTHILILTTFDVDEYVYEGIEAGASGFLLKDADPDEIVHAIRILNRGDALIQPSVMARLIKNFVPNPSQRNPAIDASSQEVKDALDSLTDREEEILKLIAAGLTNDEIAQRLFISPATVKTHISRIMSKISAHDRAQIVVFAYESGLVSANR